MVYRGFAVYLLAFTVLACGASYVQLMQDLHTGTWFDLAWTVPLLGAALWAARWQPATTPQALPRLRSKGIGDLVLTNATLALAPGREIPPGGKSSLHDRTPSDPVDRQSRHSRRTQPI